MASDADTAGHDPLREELRAAVQGLTATVQTLAQVTQLLHATAERLTRSVAPADAAPADGAPPSVDVWEDDPFSERTPTTVPPVASPVSLPAPGSGSGSLPWRISDQRPSSPGSPPGGPEFRYRNAEFTLGHAVGFWTTLVPQGTRWSTFGPELPVALDVGRDLNANYSRPFGLRFYHETIEDVPIFSGASPDVIRHELGHALLDALRPELFDAASFEVDAFHEAFGDVSALLLALQLPTFRQRLLAEVPGRLNDNSRLSRLAEQLGWGIRQLSPDAVDRDCLRNAANRFRYQAPASLPDQAPAAELSRAPHSFSRVFTGAVLDALTGMVDAAGGRADANLETAGRDLAQVLLDGILAAPVTPTFYSQVAAAMVQAARVRAGGRYQSALLGAFVGRGLLDLVAARSLESAATPTYRAAGAAPGAALGAVPAAGAPPEGGTDVLLGYEPPSGGHRADATQAPGLPLTTVHAEFLDQPVTCHAPAEAARFAVAPSVYGQAQSETDPTESARQYLATLLRLGRLDPGPAPGMARGATPPDPERRTHRLEARPEGLVLKRVQFM